MATLADLYLRKGDLAADSIRRTADIEAHRRATNANLVGQGIGAAANLGAQAVGAWQQEKIAKPLREHAAYRQQLQDVKLGQDVRTGQRTEQDKANNDFIDQVMGSSLVPGEFGDGARYDADAVTNKLEQAGRTDLVATALKRLGTENDLFDSRHLKNMEILRHFGETVEQSGYNRQIFRNQIKFAMSGNVLGKDYGKAVLDQLAEYEQLPGPDAEMFVKNVTDAILSSGTGRPKPKPMVVGEGSSVIDANAPAGPPLFKSPNPAFTPDQAADNARLDRVADSTIQHQRAMEAKDRVDAVPEIGYKIDPQSTAILGQTGLSQNAFLAATGQTSSLPRDRNTRNAATREWQNYAVQHGIDTSTFVARYHAITKTLEANALRNNQAEVSQEELDSTLQNIKVAADEASFGRLRWGNIAKVFAGQEVNDAAVTKYKFHLEQLRSELAMYNAAIGGQIDANGNIREVNQNDLARADSIIRDGFAAGSIDGFAAALTASRDKMKVVLDNSVTSQNKRVWDLFGVGGNYKRGGVTQTAPEPEPELSKRTDGLVWKSPWGLMTWNARTNQWDAAK
jgi:hypothetical protein